MKKIPRREAPSLYFEVPDRATLNRKEKELVAEVEALMLIWNEIAYQRRCNKSKTVKAALTAQLRELKAFIDTLIDAVNDYSERVANRKAA